MTKFSHNLEKNKDISNFLTLHTQVIAKYYCEVRSKEDFQQAIKAAHDRHLPFLILGGGSNIVITTNFINALVVRNCYIKKEVIRENEKEVELFVSSGYPTNALVLETIEHGYEGLEYHKGLPGTVGGAVYMNSKWTKPLRYVGDYLIKAVISDDKGNLREVDRQYFDFKYDYSKLHKTKETLVDLIFCFKKVNKKILEERSKEALDYRLKTQPKGVSTCGCFFRNISEQDKLRLNFPTNSVGYILDKLNLKGLTVGDFMISDVHANFIINRASKKGDIKDLKKLLKIIKDRVKEEFEVELEEEVIII